ncbi:valine--tRNA ligase [Candidatus Pacearchaeota archaeon]|nr:MAG: valine--tRNA ligase [Candidatus Pacearchaeota archaeon]
MAKKPKLDLREIENKWREFWEKEEIFKFNPSTNKKIFSIDTPPPYASSGHLHVGHALHYTQFEIIARVMRLLGREVYFPPGFDDNGLPTEKYVETKLGVSKKDVDREEFRKICLEESRKVEKDYAERVFKKLGHSYDWSLLYQTISPEAQRVAQTAFVRLYNQGDCYRKEEPVIWCPYHQTALAQAEVEDLKRTTTLNYIDFELAEGGKITIATTRPEFLPACVGIFVHPQDERYKSLVGKKAIVPIFKQEVEIMADEKVEQEFGTGIVMVCTFGDNTDIEWWKKHNLELRNMLNPDGTLNEIAGELAGKPIEDARREIIEKLRELGKLEKQEKLEQVVGACWRCGTPVEYIVTKQWFVRTLKYKKELIERAREIKWHPEFMRKRFEDWTNNLNWDWIISRQRYYGVPIPAWYCERCNEIIVANEDELPVDPTKKEKKCEKCGATAKPEEDVFDTWMTSSNTPEIAGRWLEKPEIYEKLAPFSLRPQSHDIIRTWAFYTILKSHLLFNRRPWNEVMIGTYVLDAKGKAMHKSKGNAIWAEDLIEKYGIDAFRYWVSTASIGSDLPFNETELVAGQRLITKLHNAANFVFMNLEGFEPDSKSSTEIDLSSLEKMDAWLLVKLSKTLDKVREHFENYEIHLARLEAEEFFWHTFADNYIEIVKRRIYSGNGKEKRSAQLTLYHAFLAILKMFSPVTCFITEDIFQRFYASKEGVKSIHISSWPAFNFANSELAEDVERVGDRFVELLKDVRKAKSNAKRAMNAKVKLGLANSDMELLAPALEDFKGVTCAEEIKQVENCDSLSVEFLQ